MSSQIQISLCGSTVTFLSLQLCCECTRVSEESHEGTASFGSRKWKAEALIGGAAPPATCQGSAVRRVVVGDLLGAQVGTSPPVRGGERVWIVCARQKVTSDIRARSAFHSSAHAYVTRAPILRSCRFPLRRPWKISFFPPFQPTRVPLSRRIISFTASEI